MEDPIRPENLRNGSEESTVSDDYVMSLRDQIDNDQDYDSEGNVEYTPGSSIQDGVTPLTDLSSPIWPSYLQSRQRGGGEAQDSLGASYGDLSSPKPSRPGGPARQISSTYQPNRKPMQKSPYMVANTGVRHRSYSNSRDHRVKRDPNAQYQAQEKPYIRYLRQDPYQDYFSREPYTPSVDPSNDSDLEAASPTSDVQIDADNYDQDTQLFYQIDKDQPSVEEIQVPENRERLEWHSMLASVLRGDVVQQEKQRLIGSVEQKSEKALINELWLGIRAKTCGRTLPAQRRSVEEGRANIIPEIEAIIGFSVKGEMEVGKPAAEQVLGIVQKIEKCESLFPTRQALGQAVERAASPAFNESSEAVVSWYNITQLINTQLSILRSWVGNEELDFTKVNTPKNGAALRDDSSFLDRLNKDDSLTSLQGDEKGNHSMLKPVAETITKAKTTLIGNAEQFAKRHLPPYMEELLTLINYPSRLIQEIIRMRLQYVVKMKDPGSLEPMMQAQMISQFRILLKLAVRIKQDYTVIAQPEPGWELPPCIDENFDLVVLDALKFYFKMLNGKLVGNRNTFKEAEILEQEWEFSNDIGHYLDDLQRTFEKELIRKPEQNASDMNKRHKQMLDSVRVRQRKLFRFSRLLSQRFENATEFNISLEHHRVQALYDALIDSHHFLIECPNLQEDGVYLIACSSLYGNFRVIQAILGTSYHSSDYVVEDPHNPYVLVLRPEQPLHWDGKKMEVPTRAPSTDIRPGRLRLVADGSLQRLQNARSLFLQSTGVDLPILTEMRANLSRVNLELGKIKKTAYKLSNTIMESVEIIQKQTKGLENQELIQTCFAFATEFGKRSVTYMDANRRMMNNMKLTKLALDWVTFICDDCIASDRKTFRWAVTALEFGMIMTQGPNILNITDEEFTLLRTKVAGCMSLLISHFDIMGAKSTLAAQVEKQRVEALASQLKKMDISKMKDDAEATSLIREQWMTHLNEIEETRKQKITERQALGRVMEDTNDADRSLTYLSSSATNVTMRWQLGQFVGGGTFGSVYAAFNIDSGSLMAVKEIRLQDPQLIPTVAGQIRDEQRVLEVLDHPNIVAYYGIEVHRDKVYIFMEYCSGGSLAGLLEHGRIEDETVIQVYALQMLEGLAYLHQNGITHRDIKPENILLDHNGVIKFVDFGAAKVIARTNKTLQPEVAPIVGGPAAKAPAKQKSMTGTPMYMSPEVIKGISEGTSGGRLGSTDMWSLGCVVLEMATGRRPWASLDNEWAIMYNIAQGNAPQLPSREQLSQSGIDLLNRSFVRDPNKRATAAELLQCPWIQTIKEQVVPMEESSPTDRSSSNASTLSSRQNSSLSNGAKTGIIVGVVLAVVFLLGLLLGICCCLMRRKRRRNRAITPVQHEEVKQQHTTPLIAAGGIPHGRPSQAPSLSQHPAMRSSTENPFSDNAARTSESPHSSHHGNAAGLAGATVAGAAAGYGLHHHRKSGEKHPLAHASHPHDAGYDHGPGQTAPPGYSSHHHQQHAGHPHAAAPSALPVYSTDHHTPDVAGTHGLSSHAQRKPVHGNSISNPVTTQGTGHGHGHGHGAELVGASAAGAAAGYAMHHHQKSGETHPVPSTPHQRDRSHSRGSGTIHPTDIGPASYGRPTSNSFREGGPFTTSSTPPIPRYRNDVGGTPPSAGGSGRHNHDEYGEPPLYPNANSTQSTPRGHQGGLMGATAAGAVSGHGLHHHGHHSDHHPHLSNTSPSQPTHYGQAPGIVGTMAGGVAPERSSHHGPISGAHQPASNVSANPPPTHQGHGSGVAGPAVAAASASHSMHHHDPIDEPHRTSKYDSSIHATPSGYHTGTTGALADEGTGGSDPRGYRGSGEHHPMSNATHAQNLYHGLPRALLLEQPAIACREILLQNSRQYQTQLSRSSDRPPTPFGLGAMGQPYDDKHANIETESPTQQQRHSLHRHEEPLVGYTNEEPNYEVGRRSRGFETPPEVPSRSPNRGGMRNSGLPPSESYESSISNNTTSSNSGETYAPGVDPYKPATPNRYSVPPWEQHQLRYSSGETPPHSAGIRPPAPPWESHDSAHQRRHSPRASIDATGRRHSRSPATSINGKPRRLRFEDLQVDGGNAPHHHEDQHIPGSYDNGYDTGVGQAL
ncbi:uncharacterized protein KY384_002076 [Bacidia gigantensis]|uniref:uncharacterized protein n=1 Tax=Bacidia gigantensis TaxID=2732470 RepID=UPI001D036547|nr:uncharacterized protein KY384_002076 [Bacidia gigantensis]KAG8533293.1 hypothetical protein KY384_002076 [Bacidia gigantensis]